MAGFGRDLCGSPSPTPLPKQGHLQQAAQDLVQAGLEYLQRGRLHNLPGQPVPVLRHPQREEVLPHVQTELPMLRFVPIASICLIELLLYHCFLPFPAHILHPVVAMSFLRFLYHNCFSKVFGRKCNSALVTPTTELINTEE